MSSFDVHPPPQVLWDQILVRRTVDRRTGVVIAEENVHDLTSDDQTRRLLGSFPKEILTAFLYWDGDRILPSVNVVKATNGKSLYLSLTNDLFNLYGNDPKLIPRATYRTWVMVLEPSPMGRIPPWLRQIVQESLSPM